MLPTVDSTVDPPLVMVVTTAETDSPLVVDDDSDESEAEVEFAAPTEVTVEEPTVVSMVEPSLVSVETTGTVETTVVEEVSDPEASVPEPVTVVEPTVVSMVEPSLVMVETTGTVDTAVAEADSLAVLLAAAEAVETTEEKTARAARVVPEAVAWAVAGTSAGGLGCVCSVWLWG